MHSRYTKEKADMLRGSEVTEDFYFNQLEVLPPTKTKREEKRMVAFMVGEPNHHHDGIPLYATFGNFGDRYFRLGYMSIQQFQEMASSEDLLFLIDEYIPSLKLKK